MKYSEVTALSSVIARSMLQLLAIWLVSLLLMQGDHQQGARLICCLSHLLHMCCPITRLHILATTMLNMLLELVV
jgi:hypothetical protein